jgi:hypothetical protein
MVSSSQSLLKMPLFAFSQKSAHFTGFSFSSSSLYRPLSYSGKICVPLSTPKEKAMPTV